MATKLRPARLTVLIGLAAIVVCSVAVFCTIEDLMAERLKNARLMKSAKRRESKRRHDAKLPADDELNLMAQKYFEQEGWAISSKILRHPAG